MKNWQFHGARKWVIGIMEWGHSIRVVHWIGIVVVTQAGVMWILADQKARSTLGGGGTVTYRQPF